MTSNPTQTSVPPAGGRTGIPLATFLPFAAGYSLSYLFQTINGPMADRLVASFHLGARDIGLLTSAYFLTFAACQIPAGLLLDRYGPRRVQAVLLLFAALGAGVFAVAQGPLMLIAGRALIGLGCSASLITGLKACSLWLPQQRRPIGTCLLVMCGGLGAMASTVPLDIAAASANWRTVFGILAFVMLAVALFVHKCVPQTSSTREPSVQETLDGLLAILRDRRFWRVAPVSATVAGTAFAVHGLWAARWLADVTHTPQSSIGSVLLMMGVALTVGAILFGAAATYFRRRGVAMTTLFGDACVLFLTVQAIIVSNIAVATPVMFAAFAIFGAITVLSFTVIGELFPVELAGRANGVLNVLHLGAACAIQAGFGTIVGMWPTGSDGRPPSSAYVAALAATMLLQAVAFAWFAVAAPRSAIEHAVRKRPRRAAAGQNPLRLVTSQSKLAQRPDLDPDEKNAVRAALKIVAIGLVLMIGLTLSVRFGAVPEPLMASEAPEWTLAGF
jgi:MFS family permease